MPSILNVSKGILNIRRMKRYICSLKRVGGHKIHRRKIKSVRHRSLKDKKCRNQQFLENYLTYGANLRGKTDCRVLECYIQLHYPRWL